MLRHRQQGVVVVAFGYALAITLVGCVILYVLNQRTGPTPVHRPFAPAATPAAAGPAFDLPARSAGPCLANLSACGYPDESTVGPRAEPRLRVPADATVGDGWSWDPDGFLSVKQRGAVVTGLDIAGPVVISADDVTLRDCRIRFAGRGGDSFGVSLSHASHVTIQNCNISGAGTGTAVDTQRLTAGIKALYGDESDIRVISNDISASSCGVQINDGAITSNFIHGLSSNGSDHVNGVLSDAGGRLSVEHNTVVNPLGQTGAITLYETFGVQYDKTIAANLLAGGGYTIYGGGPDHGRGAPSGIRITDNRFATGIWPEGGQYGPVAYFDGSAPGNVWQNNIWDDPARQDLPTPR